MSLSVPVVACKNVRHHFAGHDQVFRQHRQLPHRHVLAVGHEALVLGQPVVPLRAFGIGGLDGPVPIGNRIRPDRSCNSSSRPCVRLAPAQLAVAPQIQRRWLRLRRRKMRSSASTYSSRSGNWPCPPDRTPAHPSDSARRTSPRSARETPCQSARRNPDCPGAATTTPKTHAAMAPAPESSHASSSCGSSFAYSSCGPHMSSWS